jgi:predicted transposase YbfD/YdcC
MDAPQYSHLCAALTDVPDPRKRRGRRSPWPVLLTPIAAALVSGQQGVRAVGQGVAEHAEDLILQLALPGRVPRTATLRRALRAVDVTALEDRLARFAADLPAPATPPATPPAWSGLAVDGKAVRGANRHGARVHLVSVVRHADGRVLGQVKVADKTNEIGAAPGLLAGRPLAGAVATMDAQLAQRALADQILGQGGHYLMAAKENQPGLRAAIDRLFADPPPVLAGDCLERATTREKGHGRLETRTLERSAALTGYLTWPGARQAMRRTCRRVIVATGEVQEETTYGVTSLPPAAASAALIEALWRGHWAIENKVHRVRDGTFAEDAWQVRAGAAPQALAALRNGLLSLWRALGWASIADAVRHYQASAQRAVRLLALTPALP